MQPGRRARDGRKPQTHDSDEFPAGCGSRGWLPAIQPAGPPTPIASPGRTSGHAPQELGRSGSGRTGSKQNLFVTSMVPEPWSTAMNERFAAAPAGRDAGGAASARLTLIEMIPGNESYRE